MFDSFVWGVESCLRATLLDIKHHICQFGRGHTKAVQAKIFRKFWPGQNRLRKFDILRVKNYKFLGTQLNIGIRKHVWFFEMAVWCLLRRSTTLPIAVEIT